MMIVAVLKPSALLKRLLTGRIAMFAKYSVKSFVTSASAVL